MGYTDQASIEAYIQRSLTAYEVTLIATLIPAIQLWLDGYLDTTFDSTVGPTTRYYDGGVGSLDIDPCHDVTAVKQIIPDGTVSYEYVADLDYILEPRNDTIKREIVRRYGRFMGGISSVAVTATFSEYEGSIPADVKMACTRIASDIIRDSSLNGTGNIEAETIEGHSVKYRNINEIIDKVGTSDPFVQSLIDGRKQPLVY